MKKSDLYRQAVELWGQNSQLYMLAEEASEMSAAVHHFVRRTNTTSYECLVGEIADVEIMIEQVKYMLRVAELGRRVAESKQHKLDRLEERIRKAQEDEP